MVIWNVKKKKKSRVNGLLLKVKRGQPGRSLGINWERKERKIRGKREEKREKNRSVQNSGATVS